MQENIALVQRGLRVLGGVLAPYIGQVMKNMRGDLWWSDVKEALGRQWEMSVGDSYEERVSSLDMAACLQVLDRRWNEVFGHILPRKSRSYANELKMVRNQVAHSGQNDLGQEEAERALSTMVLLCQEIDAQAAETLREIYREMRQRAAGTGGGEGLAQPASESRRGELKEGSLLSLVGTDAVQRTSLTRRITYGGKTVDYPVYRVRLDHLFYNDQNDRIATWISQYEANNGVGELAALGRAEYNRVIEQFIFDSNADSIRKTQKNIEMIGQHEPGVTLADGRVVDGNRRFTCLRRLQRETAETLYFETAIMDMDIQADKKQIKLLELAVQYGEEKKVDYDLVDLAVGTYRDIIAHSLLTVEEYAEAANESPAEVRKRLSVMEMISAFLEYLRLPAQYHVAKDYQVYSLFQEMQPLMRTMDDSGKQRLMQIVFHNVMMRVMPDQRKFIRDIKNLIKNDMYETFASGQQAIEQQIGERFAQAVIEGKADVEAFAAANADLTEELQLNMERSLLRLRSRLFKAKPSENVQKCIELLMDVDGRTFLHLSEEEKSALADSLDALTKLADDFKKQLG